MIVRQHKEGWKIISHYTHGLVAGKFAEQLDPKLRPQHWVETITAIIEHDDHLLDFGEGDYLTENGSPKDFMMAEDNDKEALEHAERVYENCVQKSQLVGLLVGRHLSFLYEGLAQDYSPMNDFLTYIRNRAKDQRKLYSLKKSAVESIYQLMRFCDRCSLIVCQGTIPETGRKLEINQAIENKSYFVHKDESEDYIIEPWPFEKDEFTIEIEYRILNKPSFENPEELKIAISDAKVHLETLSFRKN